MLETVLAHNPSTSCRVTSQGSFLPLQIFLHQNPDGSPSPLGWGVRCAVDIAAGTFLSAYTGIVAVNSEVPAGSTHVMCLDHFLHAAAEIRKNPKELTTVRKAVQSCMPQHHACMPNLQPCYCSTPDCVGVEILNHCIKLIQWLSISTPTDCGGYAITVYAPPSPQTFLLRTSGTVGVTKEDERRCPLCQRGG